MTVGARSPDPSRNLKLHPSLGTDVTTTAKVAKTAAGTFALVGFGLFVLGIAVTIIGSRAGAVGLELLPIWAGPLLAAVGLASLAASRYVGEFTPPD